MNFTPVRAACCLALFIVGVCGFSSARAHLIGVTFDFTVYDRYVSPDHVGPPVPAWGTKFQARLTLDLDVIQRSPETWDAPPHAVLEGSSDFDLSVVLPIGFEPPTLVPELPWYYTDFTGGNTFQWQATQNRWDYFEDGTSRQRGTSFSLSGLYSRDTPEWDEITADDLLAIFQNGLTTQDQVAFGFGAADIIYNRYGTQVGSIFDSFGGAGYISKIEILDDQELSPVPEPSTYGLLGSALLVGLIAWKRKRLQTQSVLCPLLTGAKR